MSVSIGKWGKWFAVLFQSLTWPALVTDAVIKFMKPTYRKHLQDKTRTSASGVNLFVDRIDTVIKDE